MRDGLRVLIERISQSVENLIGGAGVEFAVDLPEQDMLGPAGEVPAVPVDRLRGGRGRQQLLERPGVQAPAPAASGWPVPGLQGPGDGRGSWAARARRCILALDDTSQERRRHRTGGGHRAVAMALASSGVLSDGAAS